MVFCFACAAPIQRGERRCPSCKACSVRYLRTGGRSAAWVWLYILLALLGALLFESVWFQKESVLDTVRFLWSFGRDVFVTRVVPTLRQYT